MIEKSAFLACAPSAAFRLFTERASEWWPGALRHTVDPRSTIRMESSGRFWERAGDGHEIELGRVLVWEPPALLRLDFYPGTDAEHPTQVTVSFAAEGAGTRVIVVHRPKSESADLWQDRAHRYERAWTLVLEAIVATTATA